MVIETNIFGRGTRGRPAMVHDLRRQMADDKGGTRGQGRDFAHGMVKDRSARPRASDQVGIEKLYWLGQ